MEGGVEVGGDGELEEVVGAGEDDGLEGLHVAAIGFGVDGPEVGVNADDGEGEVVEEGSDFGVDVEREHVVHGLHGDGGGCGGHVGEDPFAEGRGGGGDEHGLDEGAAGGGEVGGEGGGHGEVLFPGEGELDAFEGVDGDEAEDAGAVDAGGVRGDDSAHGVAEEDEGAAVEVAEDGLDVVAEGFHGVVGAGGTGVAVAGEVDGDDALGGGEEGDLFAEVAGVAVPAVDEDEGGFAGAVYFVGDGGAVGGGDDARGRRGACGEVRGECGEEDGEDEGGARDFHGAMSLGWV